MTNRSILDQLEERIFVGKPSIEFIPQILPNSSEAPVLKAVLCAPYPPCNPLGCDDVTLAPIQCENCDVAAVAMTLIGMVLISIIIITTNVLVIAVIWTTTKLRRKHGYIKISLAASDLLIGIFVLPSAIYNICSTLFFPTLYDESVLPNDKSELGAVNDLLQMNTGSSVFFGSILILSVTSSIYNLLMLSLDRCLAVTRPLQNRGKYYSKKRLGISLGAVWVLGIILSIIPACLPNQFSYVMDPTTFFFVQSAIHRDGQEDGIGPLSLFALFVIGTPYVVIVILNIITMIVTTRKLAHRKRLGSYGGNSSDVDKSTLKIRRREQANRMKIILENCPEMSISESDPKDKRFSWWDKVRMSRNFSSNNNAKAQSGSLSNSRTENVSSTLVRKRTDIQITKRLNARVLRMISTMVAAFTVCICPYVVVNGLLYNGDLNCGNVGVIYNIATYLVILNSGMNFFIYNFWHREFRHELFVVVTRKRQRDKANRNSGLPHSSERGRFTTPSYSRGRDTTRSSDIPQGYKPNSTIASGV